MRPVAFALLFAVTACHSHSDDTDGPTASEYFYDCENQPAGVTAATSDEAFRAFVNAEVAGAVMADDSRAVTLTSPAAGTTLSVNTPPAFAFTPPTLAQGPLRAPPAVARRPSRWARLRRLFAFEGVAHAHCPAVTGTNYVLRVTDGQGAALYTAALSVSSFTPGAAAWKAAMAGREGQTINVRISRAQLNRNNITDGPYVPSSWPTFVIGP